MEYNLYFNEATSNKMKGIKRIFGSLWFLVIIILYVVCTLISFIDNIIETFSSSNPNIATIIIAIPLSLFLSILVIYNLVKMYQISNSNCELVGNNSLLKHYKTVKIIIIIISILEIIAVLLSMISTSSLITLLRQTPSLLLKIEEMGISSDVFLKLSSCSSVTGVFGIIGIILLFLTLHEAENKALKDIDYNGKCLSLIIYPIFYFISVVVALYCNIVLSTDPEIIKLYEITGTTMNNGQVIDVISQIISLIYSFVLVIVLLKVRKVLITEKDN